MFISFRLKKVSNAGDPAGALQLDFSLIFLILILLRDILIQVLFPLH